MAATFDEIIKKFPQEVQGYVRSIWDSLSPAEQASLLKLTEGIPTEAGLVKILIQLSATQLKQTFRTKISGCHCWTGECRQIDSVQSVCP